LRASRQTSHFSSFSPPARERVRKTHIFERAKLKNGRYIFNYEFTQPERRKFIEKGKAEK
ncbi:hypothetical protein, partial [Parasutterella excrementihominis]|uniref:hypothetical protein n=1 Tax=Parasutterella excrementihominis TaxID=487175 RepID=UPI003AABA357